MNTKKESSPAEGKALLIQGDYKQAIGFCRAVFGDFFEFRFSYVSDSEIFRELDRFIWESKHHLRFRNEFEGTAVIDLSAWNNCSAHEFSEYFDAFMFYLQSKSDKINCAFMTDTYGSVPLKDKLKSHFDKLCPVDLKPKEKTAGSGITIGFHDARDGGKANV